MYKEDLALNNLKWLICHKTQANQTKLKPNQTQTKPDICMLTVSVAFVVLEIIIINSAYRVQILNKAVCIRTYTLWKGMNTTILPPVMNELQDRLGYLTLV